MIVDQKSRFECHPVKCFLYSSSPWETSLWLKGLEEHKLLCGTTTRRGFPQMIQHMHCRKSAGSATDICIFTHFLFLQPACRVPLKPSAHCTSGITRTRSLYQTSMVPLRGMCTSVLSALLPGHTQPTLRSLLFAGIKFSEF